MRVWLILRGGGLNIYGLWRRFFCSFLFCFFFFAVWSFWLVWDGARVCVCVRAATLDWEGRDQLLMVMALGFASNGRGSLTDVVMC